MLGVLERADRMGFVSDFPADPSHQENSQETARPP